MHRIGMSSTAVVWWCLAVVLCRLSRVSCVPSDVFLPYGIFNGDSSLEPADNSFANVSLGADFMLLGESYSSAYINTDGIITFGGPAPQAGPTTSPPEGTTLVAPFWSDADTSSSGNVFYRLTYNAELLENVASTITTSFMTIREISLSWLFVVTWDEVPATGNSASENNSFQCILTSNGTLSFVLFLYKDGAMQWTKGTAPGSNQHAVVGLSAGGDRHFILPSSGSEQVLEITETGNTGSKGQWLFQVEDSEIQLPAPMVGMERVQYSVPEDSGTVKVCAMMHYGQLSRDIDISLETRDGQAKSNNNKDYTAATMELTLGPHSGMKYCLNITITPDTVVEANETLEVVLKTTDDYVTLLPSTATVSILDDDTVNVAPFTNIVQVLESSGSLSLCVSAEVRVERKIHTHYVFHDGTAIEGTHYQGSSSDAVIHRNRYGCTSVTIIDNSVYDVGGRVFYAELQSNDRAVNITQSRVIINISDQDAESVVIGFEQRDYTGSEEDGNITVCALILRGEIAENIDVRITTDLTSFPGVHDTPADLNRDYGDTDKVVTFMPDSPGPLCHSVPIFRDDILEDSESFTVELHKVNEQLGYGLNPLTTRVVVEDRNSATATLEQAEFMVDEGTNTFVKICARVEGLREIDIELVLTPHEGNATAGKDYINHPVTFTVHPTEDRGCGQITIKNDFVMEELYETFWVELTSMHPRVYINESRANVTIRDIDEFLLRPYDNPGESTVAESTNKTHSLFCALYKGALETEVYVRFHTVDASAVANEDYIPFDKTEVIGPQNLTRPYGDTGGFCTPFSLIDDIIVEGTESFFVVMTPISDRVKPYIPGEDRIEVHITDDDVVRIIPTSTNYYVRENEGHVTICATMSGLSERWLNISLTAEEGTAKEGVEYRMDSRFLHFPSYLTTYGHLSQEQVELFSVNPPDTHACTNITILDDDVVEQLTQKSFTVHFTSESLSYDRLELPSEGVTITVQDDDVVSVALDSVPFTVGEGDGQVSVVAVLSGVADYPISATIHTRPYSGPSATPGADYDAAEISLTFPPSTTRASAQIPIMDDDILEDRESFEIVLQATSTGVFLGEPSTAPVWIEDNDRVWVGLQESELRVLESEGQLSVCCELNGATGKNITVSLVSVEGSAQDGVDYSAPPTDLVFPPSSESRQTQCVELRLIDDTILEDVETFQLRLSTSASRVNITQSSATVSLVDNDRVYVSLERNEYTTTEDEEGVVEVCVELVGVTATEVEVQLSTVAGTAQAGADFTSTSRSIEFLPSSASNQTVCTSLRVIIDDDIVESTETFFVELQAAGASVSDNIRINRAKILVEDSDQVSVGFEQSSYSVVEGEGEVSVCAVLGAVAERRVTVQITTSGGTAEEDTDFTQTTTELTFEPGSSAHQCSAIAILDDTVLENEEQFTVHLLIPDPSTYVEGGSGSAVVLIGDNDNVSVSLEREEYSVEEAEGGEVEVCVELREVIERAVEVDLFTEPGTAQADADYTAATHTITFHPAANVNQTSCASFGVIDDTIVENTETFVIRLTTRGEDVGVNINEARVHITDSDQVSVGFEQSSYSVVEGEGEVSVCAVLGAVAERRVAVQITTSGDTAEEDTDFTQTTTELTFEPGSSAHQCSVIAILDDTILENEEQFTVHLLTPDPSLYVDSDRGSAVVVIMDDNDNVYVSLEREEYSVEEAEGGEVEVCVELREVIERAVEVDLFTEPGTAQADADYTAATHTVTFQPAVNVNQTSCASFGVIDDTIVENTETFVIRLTTRGEDVGININEARVHITDSDQVSVGFEQSSYSVVEGEGEVSVCAVLGAVAERRVTVQITTSGGTAEEDTDFTQTTTELTFEPGSSAHQCGTIAILDDTILENEEQFTVHLLTPDPSTYVEGGSGSAVVLIRDNDNVYVSLEREEYSVEEAEGGEVEVCVELREVIERAVEVDLSTEPGTAQADADYTAATHTVTFHPAVNVNQTSCASFSVIDDTIVEDTETFVVRLTTRGEDIDVSVDEARVHITDSDQVSVGFEQFSYSVVEGEGEVSVCAVLGAVAERRVTVQITTSGGTAEEDTDFNQTTTELTFEPGNSAHQCGTIAILDDTILENEEQFTVHLLTPDPSTYVEDNGLTTVTITNDDHVTVGVVMERYWVDEGDSEVEVCVAVQGEMERSVNVMVETAMGTAEAGGDFIHVSQEVTFEPRDPQEPWCTWVELVDDLQAEEEESFSIILSSPLEGSVVELNPKSAYITITDGDIVCPIDVTTSPRGEYVWPRTVPDNLVEFNCTFGDEGVAQRYCNENGTWEIEDTAACHGKTEELFVYLDELPFSCEDFYELLQAVMQATDERDFRTSYLATVTRYFRDFAEITKAEGYILEKQTCHGDIQTFSTGVDIINQLHKWSLEVLQTNSTKIMLYFETVSEALVANPKAAFWSISREHIVFSSIMDERASLERRGIMREFYRSKSLTHILAATKSTAPVEFVLGTIVLPPSLFKTLSDDNTRDGIWFSLHENSDFFPIPEDVPQNETVGSPVISATVGGESIVKLDEPVLFTLRILNESVRGVRCVSWDYELEDWTSDGCDTGFVSDDGIVNCSCNHLTNFACLVDIRQRVEGVPPPPAIELALSIISIVGIMLSLVGLTITIFTLLFFSKLRKRDSTKFRVQLCISLILLLLSFGGQVIVDYTQTEPVDIPILCSTLSALTQYFTLTSLLWMGAEAVLMFRKLVLVFGFISKAFYIGMSLICWLLPVPFVIVPAAINREWMVSEDFCFISHFPVFLAAFMVPLGLILVFNSAIFFTIVMVLVRHSSNKHRQSKPGRKRKAKTTLRTVINCVAIMTLFGLTWVFGAFTFISSEASLAFHFLFAFFNSFQGCFIFIFFCLLAKETRELWRQACCGKEEKKPQTTTVRFLSMESLGKASGIESDDDTDYPEKEKKYNEFDVTYIDRNSSLIEQKFTIAFMSEGNGNGNNNGVGSGYAGGSVSNGALLYNAYSLTSQDLPSSLHLPPQSKVPLELVREEGSTPGSPVTDARREHTLAGASQSSESHSSRPDLRISEEESSQPDSEHALLQTAGREGGLETMPSGDMARQGYNGPTDTHLSDL